MEARKVREQKIIIKIIEQNSISVFVEGTRERMYVEKLTGPGVGCFITKEYVSFFLVFIFPERYFDQLVFR